MTDHQPSPAVEAIGRLEELARAATPGNWRAWPTRRRSPEIYTDAPTDREPNDLVGSTLRKADAAFIAAANPQAILSLIEERRALREALERIATVDMGGGFLGALACRQVAGAALDRISIPDPEAGSNGQAARVIASSKGPR